jgi:hypothetical protein
MLFKRRIVQEDMPVETQIVTPVTQPVIERNTTVERDSMSGSTAIAVIFAGLVVIALVFYFAWYQPQNTVVTQPAPSTTVIDHDGGAAAQPIVTNPAPTTIINPPATNPTVVNPPANNTTVVNPPAGSSSTTTDNGDGTTTTTTNTTPPPDNNGG